MNTLRDYVEWGMTHSDKTGSAEGVPLVMENCVKNKKMKQLEVYGNSIQNGTPSPEAPVEVESVGEKCTKNLLNDNRKTTSAQGDSAETKGSTLTLDCGGNTSPKQLAMNYSTANSLTLKAGVTYTWSVTLISGSLENTSASAIYLGFRDVNASWVKSSTSINVVLGMFKGRDTNKITFTVESDTVCSFAYVGTAYADSCVYALQLEEGSVATEYEPYGKYKVPVVVNGEIFTNVYLNEPLRKVGNYADVLDFKGQKVIRNIHEEILDGINTTKFNVAVFSVGTAKALRLSYKGTYAQYYLPTADGLQVSYYALCNMYPVVTSGKRGEHTVSGNTASMNTFDIIDSDYQTADEWDIHLQELASAGMPLKIIHALKNPIEETIECELPTLPAKTSVVETDTSLLPSNMKGKYIKR